MTEKSRLRGNCGPRSNPSDNGLVVRRQYRVSLSPIYLSISLLLCGFGLGAVSEPSFAAEGAAEIRPEPVWIDTDPACGLKSSDDVDDCWAIAQALTSPELEVVGIGTVFGNVDEGRAFSCAQG